MPSKITLRLALALLSLVACTPVVSAQDAPAAPAGQPSPADAPDSSSDSPVTLFPHSDTSRFWISGQANIILQWHPAFHAAYSGTNSFRSPGENDTSKLYALYTGFALTPTTEIFVDAESAGGHGLSQALGLAGFTNLDVVRNPALGPTPYLARFEDRKSVV